MKHKNDRAKDARELAGLLRGMLCHVNLIPINPVAGAPYEASSAERILAFSKVLEKSGIPVTVRRTLGQDIQAACGQLRRDKQTEDVK